jgi:uncharacterized membrane protein YfcA
MILIIEIILTIIAWRRGWKWRSLLPLMVGFVIAFILGSVLGLMFGGIPPIINIVGFLIDLVIIIFLVVMIAEAPKEKMKIEKNENSISGS